MPQLRVAQAAALLGVSDDTVRRWGESGRLDVQRDASGRGVVDGEALARLAQQLADAPVPARSTHSARNRLPGIITKVTRDTVMASVELQAGPHRVLSLLSREAADELGLAVGMLATASIKSTNVVVEVEP